MKNRGVNEEEFFGFGGSYLSEAFANPQRVDCPPDSDLMSMAEHLSEAAHAHVSQHLTCCSPCLSRYVESLADLKKRRKAG